MKSLVLTVVLFLSLNCFAGSETVYVDKVVVRKAERKMYLLKDEKIYREYKIALGDNPVGHKQQEGDERTPEGIYTIDYRNPQSSYHLSLHIDYPNKHDKESARRKGVDPGGAIFIHGSPNGFGFLGKFLAFTDWTDGCIAVTDKEIEEIWKLVQNGTFIEILP